MSWSRFMAVVSGFYVLANWLFALAYLSLGEGALEGASRAGVGARFADCFFFSVQTLATIGYGRMTPHGLGANLLVTFEALLGLSGVALATGLMFARFSRPTARVVFSNRAMLSMHDGVPSLVIRMANARLNQILEARARVSLVRDEVTIEGERYRNFYDLKLERGESPIFALSWTVVHPIDRESPLYGVTAQGLSDMRAEIFVSVSGLDETFGQTIHSRFSYIPDEVVFDGHFDDIVYQGDDDLLHIRLEGIHSYTPRQSQVLN
jgi:inward rectifier potassium channel